MLTPGTVLQGRYQIVTQIGGGGMGVVYLAEDNRLPGRRCAIKEASPEKLAPQDRPWAIQNFQQEAQILARLHHPGLTAVTDFFAEGGKLYLVMEFIEGETLEKRLARMPGGRLSLDEALNIIQQLCNVLLFLHSQNPPVVFRDLKPANVMITPQGEVKLIDFGIARFFKTGQAQDTMNLGTPGYAAPEQYGGLGQTDPRSDIYSLGALLLRLVTGYDPIRAATPFPLPAPGSLVRGLPPQVEEAIVRATQLQPHLRYPSVQEFCQALFAPARVISPPTLPPPPPAPPAAPTQSLSARPGKGLWIGLAVASVLLVVLCVVVIAFAASLPELFVGGGTTPPVTPWTPPTTFGGSPTSTPPRPPAITVTPTPYLAGETGAPRIVYVNGDVGRTDIYIAQADGSGATCWACAACDEAEPAWSPDGAIVYQADCSGSYDIWIARSPGGGQALTHTPAVDEREPDVSPDGARIVYRANPTGSDRNADGDLQVMNADGSGAYSLGTVGRGPAWSPDGRRIAFMSNRDGRWQIYLYDFQSGTTTRLTDCLTNCRWPAWSPDGQAVVYHSTTSASTTDADTIWIVPAAGGSPSQLVSGSHPGRPGWSRNGQIVFNSDRGIEVVNADGSGRRVLIADNVNWAPAWSE